jgi:hypothetical protein
MDAEAAASEARLRIRFFGEQHGSAGSSSHWPRWGGKERAVGDNSVGDASAVATLRCILEVWFGGTGRSVVSWCGAEVISGESQALWSQRWR